MLSKAKLPRPEEGLITKMERNILAIVYVLIAR